jgi:hypothetical protein
MAQGSVGRIRIFEDFIGAEVPVALTTDVENLGPFKIGGEGFEDSDTGATVFDSDGLNGVIRLISGNTDKDTTALMTGTMFDVGLMGPINIEVRVRMVDLDDKQVFIGLTDTNDDDQDQDTDIITTDATVVTLQASDLVGFYWSSELETSDEDWYGVYNGGTTTGVTTAASVDLDADATAGEFQVLRLEVAPDGKTRWYVDGVLKQTVAGAVSTSTDLSFNCGVSANTGQLGHLDIDYILIEANRDWTV